MGTKKIAILLATYNGEKYICEQLDSLIAQTFDNYTIYVHDDGSTDNTVNILKKYAEKHTNVKILDYPSQHGAKDNFMSLLKRVEADYYMFCDQDDVWRKDKVELEMQRMQGLEKENGDRAMLVFSDLYVVDNELNINEKSLWKKNCIRPELLTNFEEGGGFEFVTGCTMLFNNATKKIVNFEKVDKATMHDAWITLCVLKSEGIVSAIYDQLVYYRQHGDNSLGASDWSEHGRLYKLMNIFSILKRNYIHWQMLDALEYGSFFKYLKYKYLYRNKYYGKNK